MGHVGNVHSESVAAVGRTRERDGVVKVSRVDRVDGEDKTVAQIAAQRICKRRLHVERKPLGLALRSLGIAFHKVVARHNALNAEVGSVRAAEPPLDGHHAGFVAGGIRDNAREDHIALRHPGVLRREVAGQDEEVCVQARVERADRPERASGGIGAHHRHGGALDHTLHHGTTLAALAAVQAHGNRVAAHHLAQRPARQPERTLGRLHQGTVLAQDHGTGKARATNAARRPAMRSMSTLAPHGAPPL